MIRTLTIMLLVLIVFGMLVTLGACTKTVYVTPSTAPISVVTPAPTSPPPTTSNSQQWTWVPSPGNIVAGGTAAYFPLNGAYVTAGRTLSLSWSADGSLNCFILTQNQYNNFKSNFGLVSSSMASGSGASGTIIANIQNTDWYYAVLYNTSVFESVKLYQAVLNEE